MLAGAHKKSERVQHTEIYLLGLKLQYKHKTKLPLDMVRKHVLLSVQRPDYKIFSFLSNSHLKVTTTAQTIFMWIADVARHLSLKCQQQSVQMSTLNNQMERRHYHIEIILSDELTNL